MLREDLISKKSHALSREASDSFFFLLDSIAEGQLPTDAQLAEVDGSYDKISAFLSHRREFSGLIKQIHAHGSRELGTMTRPSDRLGEGFDIDLIARLNENALVTFGGSQGPERLLMLFRIAFEDYARLNGLKLKPWERCITLEYPSGMSADIAPVIDSPTRGDFGPTHGVIPDKSRASYQGTNPRGFTKFFQKIAAKSPVYYSVEAMVFDSARDIEVVPLGNANEVFAPVLCRMVQILKLHRNNSFGPKPIRGLDLKPSSAFITTLAAKAYEKQASIPHFTPLDLLVDVVRTMPDMFVIKRHAVGETWSLPNPAAPESDLAEDMNTPERQEAFRQWIRRFSSDFEKITKAIETKSGIDVVLQAVTMALGQRAGSSAQKALLKQQHEQRLSSRTFVQAPTVAPTLIRSRSHTFFGK